MREILRFGSSAVSVEYGDGVFRCLKKGADTTSELPPFECLGLWQRVSDDILKVHGFSGKRGPTRAEILLMIRWAICNGYRTVLLERADGHSAPHAKRIVGGLLDGWLEIDLSASDEAAHDNQP